jgi:hypothetical protein
VFNPSLEERLKVFVVTNIVGIGWWEGNTCSLTP